MPEPTQVTPENTTERPMAATNREAVTDSQPRSDSPAQSQSGQSAEQLPAWRKTFENEEAMWDSFRHQQSGFGQQINALKSELEERNNAFNELNEEFSQMRETMGPLAEAMQKVRTGQENSLSEQEREALAEQLITNPDSAVRDIVMKFAPALLEEKMQPLRDEIANLSYRSEADQTEQFNNYLAETYSPEFVNEVIKQIREEAAQFGDNAQNYLAQFNNPYMLEQRISAEYDRQSYMQLAQAIKEGNQVKINTLLAKENEPNPDTASGWSGGAGSPSLVSATEESMDSWWAKNGNR